MIAMPWSQWEDVGDQSEYVLEMGAIIEKIMPTVHTYMNPMYFRNFCDKFAMTIIPRYMRSIQACKRISEMGTQQLGIDAHEIKTILLQLPAVGAPDDFEVPARYTKFVNNEMLKVSSRCGSVRSSRLPCARCVYLQYSFLMCACLPACRWSWC